MSSTRPGRTPSGGLDGDSVVVAIIWTEAAILSNRCVEAEASHGEMPAFAFLRWHRQA